MFNTSALIVTRSPKKVEPELQSFLAKDLSFFELALFPKKADPMSVHFFLPDMGSAIPAFGARFRVLVDIHSVI
jgi:hypothetical protein